MKNSLLITTPYLDSIGGTEIEAIHTAVYLFDTGYYKTVSVFTPNNYNDVLFKDIIGNRPIKIFKYPKLLFNKNIKFFDRLLFKLCCLSNFSEQVFWKYKSLFYTSFFILTYPKSVYFFSILKALSKKKKAIAKITLWQLEALPENHIKQYRLFDKIIVFNNKQKEFWQNKNSLNNIVAQDILIPNEENLLKLEPIDFSTIKTLTFGYLGRISQEKNLEDMIRLIAYLIHEEKKQCHLTVQGTGEIGYINKLRELAKENKIEGHIDFNNSFIAPKSTHLFFSRIHVFLVTSVHEGGPITALEAAASGRMLLSYNVGAMHDRFAKLPFVINESLKELCASALQFINLPSKIKNDSVLALKRHYMLNLNNSIKGKQLLNLLKNES